MCKELLERFEKAIASRNARLAESFQHGLSEASIRRKLEKSGANGLVDPVVALFSWKDGTRPNAGLTMEQASVFPKIHYIFLEFDMMLAHFSGFGECATYHPRLKQIVGRYFPMFWDGSNRYVAVDLEPSSHSSVVLLDTQAANPVRKAYSSFESFLNDAIRANKMDESLGCFQPA